MIMALSKARFVETAWPVLGRRVGKSEILSDIYETSKASVALPVHPESEAINMFRLVAAEGRSLTHKRNEIKDGAVGLLSELPDCQLLTTIPGIGPINAMTILAWVGDLRRFRHHRQFLKFRGQSKISKHGNARLRRVPGMAGQSEPFCNVGSRTIADELPIGSEAVGKEVWGTALFRAKWRWHRCLAAAGLVLATSAAH